MEKSNYSIENRGLILITVIILIFHMGRTKDYVEENEAIWESQIKLDTAIVNNDNRKWTGQSEINRLFATTDSNMVVLLKLIADDK